MIIYSAGFVRIFQVLTLLLYRHALRRHELMETPFSIRVKRIIVLVAGISIAIAALGTILKITFY